MASSDASLPKEDSAAPPAAEEKKKKWRLPQEHVDFILSCDVGGDVSPNMERIERLPVSEERKAVYRAGELQGVAAANELRRIRRETQQWVRDEYEKHGYVLVEERHMIDVNLARSAGWQQPR